MSVFYQTVDGHAYFSKDYSGNQDAGIDAVTGVSVPTDDVDGIVHRRV